MAAAEYGLRTPDGPCPDAMELTHLDVEVKVNDYAARVKLSLVYRYGGHMDLPTMFTFPTTINETPLVICYCTARLRGQKREVTSCKVDNSLSYEGRACKNDFAPQPGLFLCYIGDVEPGEVVTVHLEYCMELATEGLEKVHFLMPDLWKNESSTEIVFFSGIASSYDIVDVVTNAENCYWEYVPTPPRGTKKQVNITGSNIDDFGFSMTYKDTTTASVMFAYDGAVKSRTVMLSLMPGADDDVDFRRCEYIFVIDRSSSMRSKRIQHAKETLLLFLKSLPIGCYFNIVGFGSKYEMLFTSGSQEYDGQSLALAMSHQEALTANMGGTSLYPPLEAVYNSKPIKGFKRHIFILTDGRLHYDNSCELVKHNASKARVHAFGIGDKVDRDIIMELASNGGGICEFIETTEDRSMEANIMKSLRTAMYSSGEHLTVDWNPNPAIKAITPVANLDQFGPLIPGEKRVIFFDIEWEDESVCKKHTPTPVTCTVNRTSPTSTKKCSVRVGAVLPVLADVYPLAMWQKLQYLEQSPGENRAEIVQISEAHNIASSLTYCGTERYGLGLWSLVWDSNVQKDAQQVTSEAPTPGALALQRRTSSTKKPSYTAITDALRKTTVRRLARRGGLKRLSGTTVAEVRTILSGFLRSILKDAVALVEFRNKKTVSTEDINWALNNNGIQLYGFESFECVIDPYAMRTTPLSVKPKVDLSRQGTIDIHKIFPDQQAVPVAGPSTGRSRSGSKKACQKRDSFLHTLSKRPSKLSLLRSLGKSSNMSCNTLASQMSSMSTKAARSRQKRTVSDASSVAESTQETSVAPALSRVQSNSSTASRNPVTRQNSSRASCSALTRQNSSIITMSPKAARSRKRRIVSDVTSVSESSSKVTRTSSSSRKPMTTSPQSNSSTSSFSFITMSPKAARSRQSRIASDTSSIADLSKETSVPSKLSRGQSNSSTASRSALTRQNSSIITMSPKAARSRKRRIVSDVTSVSEPLSKVTRTSSSSIKPLTTLPASNAPTIVRQTVKPAVKRGTMTRNKRAEISDVSKDFSLMIQLVTLQTFDGSWDLSKHLADVIGASLHTLRQSSPETNLKAWATTLSLAWLGKYFGHARMEWDMIQDKALRWLQSLDELTSTVPELITEAEILV